MIKPRNVYFVFLLFVLMIFLPVAGFCQGEAPAIEPRADKILRQMSDYLNSLEKFSFHTENTIDEIQTSGQKLQFGHAVDVFVRRPDRLRVNIKGDIRHQELYYDGKSITLYGKKVNYYASLKAPAKIEAALDHARESFSLEAPLADIIYRNSYEILSEGINSGSYVGLHSVDGVECHHLAFTRDDIDVQIWIEKSKTPVPRKLIITAKWVTGAPQFTARLSGWDHSPKLKDRLFNFIPPKGAEKIEFLTVEKTSSQR
ncbi:MAG: DUF2092 domain-containing protein [Desulfobacterales bacterium]